MFTELGSFHFPGWLCLSGRLNEDPAVWLSGAWPPPYEGKSVASFCHQICFATFIWRKITKLLKTQQQLKLEKISTDLKSPEF
jgi:hypothetical protein